MLGATLPHRASRKQEGEPGESIAALSSPQIHPLHPHGDRRLWEGEGRLSLPSQSPATAPLAGLSLPLSCKDRAAAPVQDTDGAWTSASKGWPWSRS